MLQVRNATRGFLGVPSLTRFVAASCVAILPSLRCLSCPGATALSGAVMTQTRPIPSCPLLGSRMPVDIDCTSKPASQRRHTLMTSNEWARACVFFRLGTRSDHLLHLFRPLSKQNDLYSTRPDSFYLNLFLFTYQGALHSLMSLMRKESKLLGLGLQ